MPITLGDSDLFTIVPFWHGSTGASLRTLADELECSREEAFGVVSSVLLWAANGNADKYGCLLCADEKGISSAFSQAFFNGVCAKDPIKVVNALVSNGYFEKRGDAFYVSEWPEKMPKFSRKSR